MPTSELSPQRGARWRLVGVLCVLVLGIIGLHSLETHCAESTAEHSVQAIAQQPVGAVVLHAVVEVQVATPLAATGAAHDAGELLLCALIAICAAVLLAVGLTRRPGRGRLMPAGCGWPQRPIAALGHFVPLVPPAALRC